MWPGPATPLVGILGFIVRLELKIWSDLTSRRGGQGGFSVSYLKFFFCCASPVILLFFAFCSVVLLPLLDLPKQRCFWCCVCQVERNWGCTVFISHGMTAAEVIYWDVEIYIQHTCSDFGACKPWFNSTCFRASKDRETANRRYCSHPFAETHVRYIYPRNYAKYVLRLAFYLFIYNF